MFILCGVDGKGYNSKIEAKNAYTSQKSNYKNKKGQPNVGYGSVGSESYTPHITTAEQMVNMLNSQEYRYFSPHFVIV